VIVKFDCVKFKASGRASLPVVVLCIHVRQRAKAGRLIRKGINNT